MAGSRGRQGRPLGKCRKSESMGKCRPVKGDVLEGHVTRESLNLDGKVKGNVC